MLVLIVKLTKLEPPRRWSMGRLVGGDLNYFDVGKPIFIVDGLIPGEGLLDCIKWRKLATHASIPLCFLMAEVVRFAAFASFLIDFLALMDCSLTFKEE